MATQPEHDDDPAASTNLPMLYAPPQDGAAYPSLDNFAATSGIVVDLYMRVKPDGFRLGDDMKGLLETVLVTIDMLDLTPIYQSRHEVGGNTIFLKSYDGVTTPQGHNFEQAVATKDAIPGSKNSGIYRTVEIPCTLAEDVSDPRSALSIEAGTSIGVTPSVTGFAEFLRFYKKLQRTDPALLQDILKVRLTHKKRTNRNNNEWGVLEFEYLGIGEG